MHLLRIGVIFTIVFYSNQMETSLKRHKLLVEKVYQSRQYLNTTELGAIMFKNKPISNKTITILYWKHWSSFQTRHIFRFGSESHDPLEGCSVQNCVFTDNDNDFNIADAVIVDLYFAQWPVVQTRNRRQIWIFYFEESPKNAFGYKNNNVYFSDLHNIFNWSMTYASAADIPVPYGRMVPLPAPIDSFENLTLSKLVPYWKEKQRDVLVAILFSKCLPYRMKLVADLNKYIKVDAYGKCGEEKFKESCPGHFKSDCKVLTKYLFYLSLENTKCKEYMTEKLFFNAYYHGAIPIIQGPTLEDCKRFLPPHSYLHVDKYKTVEDLADDIRRISEHELFNYHWWRNHFEIVNEHAYFGTESVHLCRVCQAMNYNNLNESVYSTTDLARFLDDSILCRD